MITDIADIQREVVAEDVLHPQVVVDDVRVLQMWINRSDIAWLQGSTRDRGTSRENGTGAIPVQIATRDFEAANAKVSAKGRSSCHLRASLSHRYWHIAGTRRDSGEAGAARNVLRTRIGHEIGDGPGRVDPAETAANNGLAFARDIPGET